MYTFLQLARLLSLCAWVPCFRVVQGCQAGIRSKLWHQSHSLHNPLTRTQASSGTPAQRDFKSRACSGMYGTVITARCQPPAAASTAGATAPADPQAACGTCRHNQGTISQRQPLDLCNGLQQLYVVHRVVVENVETKGTTQLGCPSRMKRHLPGLGTARHSLKHRLVSNVILDRLGVLAGCKHTPSTTHTNQQRQLQLQRNKVACSTTYTAPQGLEHTACSWAQLLQGVSCAATRLAMHYTVVQATEQCGLVDCRTS